MAGSGLGPGYSLLLPRSSELRGFFQPSGSPQGFT